MSSPIVLRLSQASTFIPKGLGCDFLLSDQELLEEVTRITDHASEKILTQSGSVIGSFVRQLTADLYQTTTEQI